ncbi:vitamin K epoxide reductase family protein [Streptomyces sp. NPDC014864]|uniref:vitamin K epoxide reductase family protein n=1 Tax=Streptomyces sp. NPDC014864 TaxID=3364924 RepID=UPI0036FECC8F
MPAGARLHRRLWWALDAGTPAGAVFVHWLLGQSLYELNKLCPYCVVVRAVTIALFWAVTLHCLHHGVLPVPRGVLTFVRDTHWMLLGGWYAVPALLVLTRFRPYWSGAPRGSAPPAVLPPGPSAPARRRVHALRSPEE